MNLEQIQPAELIPELAQAITHADGGLRFIQHAYVNTVYDPTFNALYNLQYLNKKKAIADAHDRDDFSQYVFMHERPFRLEALLMLLVEQDRIGFERGQAVLGELLVDVYIDAEGTAANSEIWRTLFARLPDEKRNRDALNDYCLYKRGEHGFPHWHVRIYRGYDSSQPDTGFSWSLEEQNAQFFADRFDGINGKVGRVKELVVPIRDIQCFTRGRDEAEVLYWHGEES